jgi:hypothetical protein
MIKGKFSGLESNQQTTNIKLDKLVQLKTENLPSAEEDGMDTYEPNPNASTRSNNQPTKTSKNDEPAIRKTRTSNGPYSRTTK